MNLRATTGIFALILSCAAITGLQHARTSRLRKELEVSREQSRTLALLEAEKSRLADAQIDPKELEQLRRDHEVIEKARASLTKLGNAVVADELSRRAVSDTRSRKATTEPEKSVRLAFADYAGNATPKAVLDSVVWAANSGNVDALAPLIAFEPSGAAAALDLFRRLPPEIQADYGSAEKVYATLLAAGIPLGLSGVKVSREYKTETGDVVLDLDLLRRNSAWRSAHFKFRPNGSGWQLVVPDAVVQRYGAMIGDSHGPGKGP